MARFIPVRSQCQFDTPGERRVADGKARNKGADLLFADIPS